MKWFKHYNNASKKAIFEELEIELGTHVGIACYWLFTEHFHSIWNPEKEPIFKISEKNLRSFLKLSPKKCQTFVKLLAKLGQISFKKNQNIYEINFFKLSDILDKDSKYNRKRIVCNDNFTTLDKDKDQDKDKEQDIIVSKDTIVDESNSSTSKSNGKFIFDLWNKSSPSILPKCKSYNTKRKRVANLRWKENPKKEFWEQAIMLISKSNFLMGKNDRGWLANFDWFVRPGNAEKIIEGQYGSAKVQSGLSAWREKNKNENRLEEFK